MTSDVQFGKGQNSWRSSPAHRHLVQFYESDDYLLMMLSQFVEQTLASGEAAIVVATDSHVNRLEFRLENNGVDVGAAAASGQLIILEAPEIMRRFMVGGLPEPAKFRSLFGGIIENAAAEWPAVRVYGEMVALTAAQRDETATLDLEGLWNELLDVRDFSLCCAYPLRTFDTESMAGLLHAVCEQHSAVLPTESYSELATSEERFREITLLQQKAAQLENEVQERANAQESLQEALAAERAAREEAEDALRLRDEFVSIAAHELKTPLTSLMGRAQLAVRRFQSGASDDPRQMAHLLQSVVGQADKLSRLIGQLLDVSRLKGGKLVIERQPVDLVALLDESVSSVQAGLNGRSLVITAPERLTAEVDPLRLEQVIVNLLNNAVRYSPGDSEICIGLDWAESDMFELTIQDQGPGIPLQERDRIFERFYQVKNGEQPTGMGLGLYICREISNLHGGEVLAEFPEQGGARFIVRMPVARCSSPMELV